MVTITFSDRNAEKQALAFLLGRFSGRVLRTGEHLVPGAALAALAEQNISFAVKGIDEDSESIVRITGRAVFGYAEVFLPDHEPDDEEAD